MPELFQAGKRTYYINCYANVGVYVCDSGEAYLIDSGTDDKEAQAIYKLLKKRRSILRILFCLQRILQADIRRMKCRTRFFWQENIRRKISGSLCFRMAWN